MVAYGLRHGQRSGPTGFAAAVAANVGVPMASALPMAVSLGHSRRWPGTIAVAADDAHWRGQQLATGPTIPAYGAFLSSTRM